MAFGISAYTLILALPSESRYVKGPQSVTYKTRSNPYGRSESTAELKYAFQKASVNR